MNLTSRLRLSLLPLFAWLAASSTSPAQAPPNKPQPQAAQPKNPQPPAPHSVLLPIPVEELTRSLKAALGDNFEVLGGDIAWDPRGKSGSARVWLAKLRPKVAGEFGLSCTIVRDPFAADAASANGVLSRAYRKGDDEFQPDKDRAVYAHPIKIGERGAPRLLRPGTLHGSSYPHANVGDTLIIPVIVDQYQSGHTFAAIPKEDRALKYYFKQADEDPRKPALVQIAKTAPVVKLSAEDKLRLVAADGFEFTRPKTDIVTRYVSAYMEFKTAAEFNVTAKLAVPEAQSRPEWSIRVVEKDRPITTILNRADYYEPTTPGRPGFTKFFPVGTIEARVGDRLILRCGDYVVGEDAKNPKDVKDSPFLKGAVTVRPFKAEVPFRTDAKP